MNFKTFVTNLRHSKNYVGVDLAKGPDISRTVLHRVADGHMIIIDDPINPAQPFDKLAALKWFEEIMKSRPHAGTPIIAHRRYSGMSIVREVMAEFRAMRRVEEALDANRFLGTCVRVLRNVERSDFPDIDQMLQDLQGLPSPDDPLYEVSLSHG